MRHAIVSLVFALSVTGCAVEAAPVEPPLPAQGPLTPERSLIDYCATATSPDVGVVFSADQVSVGGKTASASYATRSGCKKALIDFYVTSSAANAPAGYSPTFHIEPMEGAGPYAFVLTQTDCATLHLYSDVYVMKAGESSFTYLGSRTANGTWNGRCSLTFGGTLAEGFTPPATGWDTYRVAVTDQVLGQYNAAGAYVSH
jgi:hypothetical protein